MNMQDIRSMHIVSTVSDSSTVMMAVCDCGVHQKHETGSGLYVPGPQVGQWRQHVVMQCFASVSNCELLHTVQLEVCICFFLHQKLRSYG
jgi:hypothetical protein